MGAYPVPLIPKQLESAMQVITMTLLGFTTAGAAADYSKVRIGWPQKGQPGFTIDTDVSFVRCVEVDDAYNRVRDVQTIVQDGVSVGLKTTYVRVWQTFWSIYGPNSFDAARQIRSGLFSQKFHDTLATLGLLVYLVTDPSAPRRVPEEENGQWWDRVDFEARFNERVTEVEIVPSIASAEVIVENSTGMLADLVVGLPAEVDVGITWVTLNATGVAPALMPTMGVKAVSPAGGMVVSLTRAINQSYTVYNFGTGTVTIEDATTNAVLATLTANGQSITLAWDGQTVVTGEWLIVASH